MFLIDFGLAKACIKDGVHVPQARGLGPLTLSLPARVRRRRRRPARLGPAAPLAAHTGRRTRPRHPAQRVSTQEQTARDFRGSAKYASHHTHNGGDVGRRDDLWCWFYSLVYLLEGRLPWEHVRLRLRPRAVSHL